MSKRDCDDDVKGMKFGGDGYEREEVWRFFEKSLREEVWRFLKGIKVSHS
ncbi:unnamed protein product [Lupinus luteus]|uniref:Uncharacterized protein n=1 Tax=Lupinus luteus TaxID=3873 RepID=A0AAV1WJ89_LUPLU